MVVFAELNAEMAHLMPHNSSPHGRYRRQARGTAPTCSCCGAKYKAASTRERITWYYRQCNCAPKHGIPRQRPKRY
jgi:hypothetical protein